MELTIEKQLNVLAVAYSFPPNSGSGSLRNLKILKYMKDYNCKVRVLTVHEKYEKAEDGFKLLDEIPNDVEVIRTSCFYPQQAIINLKKRFQSSKPTAAPNTADAQAVVPAEEGATKKSFLGSIKDFITDIVAVPDKFAGWLPFGIRAGMRAMKQEPADVIYAVGKPWTCFFVGLALKKMYKKPLIIDFMDPWMASIWRPRKAGIIEWAFAKLEKMAVHQSDFVIANTGELRKDFINRMGVAPEKCDVITCGFDSADFHDAPKVEKNKIFTVTHTGTFYRRRTPKGFLKAVKKLLDEKKITTNDIRINLIGRILINDPELDALFADEQLKEIVHRESWVAHEKAIQYLHESDALLLVQPETHLQIPAKLYEYILIKKPLITLAQPEGAVGQIIKDEKWGETIEADDVDRIAEVVYTYNQNFKNGDLGNTITEESINNYDYKYLAKRVVGICNSTLNPA